MLLILLACRPVRTTSSLPDSASARVTIGKTQQYIVHQQLSLVNEGDGKPDKQNLWVALIRDVPPYQHVLSKEISPNRYTLVTDEYGNQYAEFDFSNHPAGTTITVDIEYKVAVNELIYDLAPCEGELPNDFTQPELHIESANPQIRSLSDKLSRGKATVCDQVRAFYDYAGDNLIYTYNQNDWGAQATLGEMGSDCAPQSFWL